MILISRDRYDPPALAIDFAVVPWHEDQRLLFTSLASYKHATMSDRASIASQRLSEEQTAQHEGDEDFLPDDAGEERSDDEYSNLSPAVRALMQKYVCISPSVPTGVALIRASEGYRVALTQGRRKRMSLYAPRYTTLLGHTPS